MSILMMIRIEKCSSQIQRSEKYKNNCLGFLIGYHKYYEIDKHGLDHERLNSIFANVLNKLKNNTDEFIIDNSNENMHELLSSLYLVKEIIKNINITIRINVKDTVTA